MQIPDDFPRRHLMGSVGGAALKYLARETGEGRYSAFVDDEEYRQAYENAEDLAQQLKGYALRKERENPAWTRESNLQRILEGIQSKVHSAEWDFTVDEQAWIMRRVIQLLEA